MSVEYIKRLAGPFIGDGSGQKVFTFGFLIFDEGDVFVSVAEEENALPRSLTLGEDFSVQMNEDQAATPGGTITLLADGLAKGAVLAIGSSVPYTQTLTLTNYTRFPPERITKELDRIVVQIQQLTSESDRSVKTDETDTQTASELKKKLLEAADTAFIIANQKAEEAKQSAEDAAASAAEAATTAATIEERTQAGIERINSELASEGDAQIDRIRAEADNTLIQQGTSCGEASWEVESDTPAGTDIVIPTGLQYLVDRKHLRVSWNGCVLYRDVNYIEVGDADTFSKTFRLTFDAQTGDEINVWVGALGSGSVAEAIATANAASDAVAELSRKVVYKDAESAS